MIEITYRRQIKRGDNFWSSIKINPEFAKVIAEKKNYCLCKKLTDRLISNRCLILHEV